MLIASRLMLQVLLILMLAACATSQNTDEAVNNDVAIIKGRSENILKEIMVPIGTKVNIDFRKIDGKDTFNIWSGAPTRIELKPGHHNLAIACFGSHDRIQFFNVTLVNIDVKGGEVYQSRPIFETPQSCSVELVRVGGNSTAADETKTAPVTKANDQSQIIFLHMHKGPVLFPKGARILVDDTTMAFVEIGTYKIVSIPPGQYRVGVDLPDLVGKCELQLTAQSGNKYYFKVFPNSEITSFVEAGANTTVIEGDVKKCEGAFALQLLGENMAKNMMTRLIRY